jgi:hypothetical protein
VLAGGIYTAEQLVGFADGQGDRLFDQDIGHVGGLGYLGGVPGMAAGGGQNSGYIYTA